MSDVIEFSMAGAVGVLTINNPPANALSFAVIKGIDSHVRACLEDPDCAAMVITGAGPGIMAAGHEGAGAEKSFGASIRLPLESEPNIFIQGNTKLINYKYFFTRKVTLIKESDAFALLPGGFGTLEEVFVLLDRKQLPPDAEFEASVPQLWDDASVSADPTGD